jgi:hypothetical protein
MSKVFSVIELENGSCGINDIYVSGIPDAGDIEALEEFEELKESLEDGGQITAQFTAYSFGEGESEPADEEDLEHFKRNYEKLQQNDELDFLVSDSFNFAVEHEETEDEEYER